jgi:hypothetical protein
VDQKHIIIFFLSILLGSDHGIKSSLQLSFLLTMDHQRLPPDIFPAQVPSVERKPVDPAISSDLLNSIKGTVCSRGDQR